jgi:uncharacterized membrane protein
MKEWLAAVSERAALAIDGLALLLIVGGTIEAFAKAARSIVSPMKGPERREAVMRYSHCLVAGLTFQLGADIIETAVASSWDALGRLAAIAAIRTFLNYFLERDIGEVRERERETPVASKAK